MAEGPLKKKGLKCLAWYAWPKKNSPVNAATEQDRYMKETTLLAIRQTSSK